MDKKNNNMFVFMTILMCIFSLITLIGIIGLFGSLGDYGELNNETIAFAALCIAGSISLAILILTYFIIDMKISK